jgi:hypothetical protein
MNKSNPRCGSTPAAPAHGVAMKQLVVMPKLPPDRGHRDDTKSPDAPTAHCPSNPSNLDHLSISVGQYLFIYQPAPLLRLCQFPSGLVARVEYDSSNRPVRLYFQSGQTSHTHILVQQWEHTGRYETLILRVSNPRGACQARTRRVRIAFDADGNIRAIRDATLAYLAHRDKLGHLLREEYAPTNHRPLRIVEYTTPSPRVTRIAEKKGRSCCSCGQPAWPEAPCSTTKPGLRPTFPQLRRLRHRSHPAGAERSELRPMPKAEERRESAPQRQSPRLGGPRKHPQKCQESPKRALLHGCCTLRDGRAPMA